MPHLIDRRAPYRHEPIHEGLNRTVAPTSEPITTAEGKTAARVTIATDNDYIDTLIQSAREWCEDFMGRAIFTQTWEWKLDRLPFNSDWFVVPYPKLASVTSIAYTDTDGDSQTLATTVYEVDTTSQPGRIALKFDQVWPSVRSQIINPVTVTFVAGTTVALGSFYVKQAIKMLVAHWYNVREDVLVGSRNEPFNVPNGVRDMLWSKRIDGFF